MNWRTNKQSLVNNYLETNPDIILMNSHGLKNNESLKIPGYACHKINSEEAINDGSAIAVKHNLKYKLLDDFDTDFLAIEIHTTQGPIVLATTYLPPRRPYLPFPDIYKLVNNNIPTLILGDFNCTHTQFGNHTNNTVGKSIVNLINQGKLIHLGPHFPTFLCHNAATSPDKVFSNKHNYLNTLIEPGNITTSDHIPIIFTVSTKPIYIKTKETLQYKKANWEQFKEILNDKITIKNLDNCSKQEIDQEVSTWFTTVKDAMNRIIPKTTYKPIYQTTTTPHIKHLEYEYNTLRNNATLNGWTYDTFREHTRIRHELKTLCKEAHNNRWENNITNLIQISKDTKTFWSKIKLLRGNNSTHTNYLVDQYGNKYYTNREQCNIMEETWRDVFRITEEEENTFDAQHSQHIEGYMQVHRNTTQAYDTVDLARLDDTTFYTRKITIDEVKKHIRRLKNKAPGRSRINKTVLLNCPNKAITALTNIFNACFASGLFPTVMKKALIRFIPKENKSPKNPINYRPISLLETPGKIFEKIILSRLNAYIIDNRIMDERQHGFRPNKGTKTAIASTYEKIANSISEKQQVIVVLRDVKKAFDKVWHSGLKYKLIQLGLPEIIQKTLCTFLDDRQAHISIGTELSNNITILSGVPQGSVLSPTLYTLFTNDLPPAGPGCTDTLYADDVTQIVTTASKSKHMMRLKLEREIDRINRFERKWKIQTSEEKFKVIPIAQHKTHKITVNGKDINSSKEGKFLGLKLQSTGLVGHVSDKIRKGKAIITNLTRFRNLTPKLKTTLVQTLLLPVIEYPPVPLCAISKTQTINMQKVLNRGLKFIDNKESDNPTMESLHLKFNIDPYNVSIHKKACKTWERVKQIVDENMFTEITRERQRKHNWFPKTTAIIHSQPPLPIYTSNS